jgi:hypothetical protein
MATNKYNRTNFIKDQVIDGILEKDLADNNWDLFEIKREMTFFTLSRGYIGRPDLLSLKLYGKMSYWWIISKVNQIDDWWNDIVVGDVIDVPDIRDIEDWYSAVRRRNT